MPDPLFSAHHEYTALGNEVNARLYEAIRPVFDALIAEGHSPRDVAYLLCATAVEFSCGAVIEARCRRAAQRRATPQVDSDVQS